MSDPLSADLLLRFPELKLFRFFFSDFRLTVITFKSVFVWTES